MGQKTIYVAQESPEVRIAVTDACVDMLTSCGLPVGQVEPGRLVALSEHDIAGFIGFSGTVRGSLIIAGSSKMFASTFPSPNGQGQSLADLLDWAGEMVNQTLGRIKRRFCEHGIDFETSTPTAVMGRHIGGRTPVRDGMIELALTVGDEVISVCFEVETSIQGAIFKSPATPIPCSHEGDLVLF
jgi:CheY-specific phosphatase CheX